MGVATVAMPRTEGYQFMTLGQLMERAGITARLLSVWDQRLAGMGGAAGFVEWTKVLRSVGAYEAYLREHHAMFDGSRVIPFLLRRPGAASERAVLPRGRRAAARVAVGRSVRPVIAAGHRARPFTARVRRPRSAAGEALATLLSELESGIQELGTLIEEDYFRRCDFGLHAFETC